MLDLTKKQREWLSHHRKQIESGLSQADYCKQNGLSKGAFSGAKNQLEKRGISARGKNLVPIFTEPKDNELKIIVNGTEMSFSKLPEPSWLALLIKEIGKNSDQSLQI